MTRSLLLKVTILTAIDIANIAALATGVGGPVRLTANLSHGDLVEITSK